MAAFFVTYNDAQQPHELVVSYDPAEGVDGIRVVRNKREREVPRALFGKLHAWATAEAVDDACYRRAEARYGGDRL